MSEQVDPYREALVVEQETVWPEALAEQRAALGDGRLKEIETALHGDPTSAGEMDYVRLHTGFCRRITVTADDLQRLK